MELKEILKYEIQSSFWASFISSSYGQELTSKYYVWKATRKYKRYLYVEDLNKRYKKEK